MTLGRAASPLSCADEIRFYSAKLDGCGGLVFFASGPDVFQDIIVRLDLSGSSQIVFDEATEPLVKIHISALVTGP